MHFLIDESKSFIFSEAPERTLGIALVAGVMLPYEGRREYLGKYKNLNKRRREDPVFVNAYLDDLIHWNVQGTLITGDIANVSKNEAENFRSQFLKPLYSFANKEPSPRKEALHQHLDNLAGKGKHKLSLQDFFKVIIILDTISELLQLYLKNIPSLRNIDLRKITLIIDDQCKSALFTLERGFTHFFLNCRSQEGKFSYQFGASRSFEQLYTHKHENKKHFDTTKFLKNIVVGEKANMDDLYPELKIADVLANSATKLFKGTISEEIENKLLKIFKFTDNRHFNSEIPCLDVIIPETSNSNVISHFLSVARSTNSS